MRYPAIYSDDNSLERATPENFHEEGYVLANPDIAIWANGGGDPRFHLEQYGLLEGRKQISRSAMLLDNQRRVEKYERFKDILDPDGGDGGHFEFRETQGSFPLSYGTDFAGLEHYEGESAHGGLGQFDDEIEANPHKRYLEVGCGLRRDLLPNCLYLEVYPSRSADIVMTPSCRYPIATGSLDGIGCFAVLEHVTEPWIVAQEFRRMLKPGGKLYIDWPALAPVHGYPSHYYNATRAGLERMFQDGFDIIGVDTRNNQTPERALRWILLGWANGLTDDALRAEMLGKTVAELIAEEPRSPFWKRILAATPDDIRMTYAAGNTLVASRNDQ